jgi:DNA replication regulator DPB11
LKLPQSIDEYRLLPFRGLKLAISGVEPGKTSMKLQRTARPQDILTLHPLLPVSRRNEVQNFILSLGGVYSKNLDRTCTHLIVARPSSPCTDFTPSAKVSWALSIKPVLYTGGIQDAAPTDYIHVVWEGWFWDCVEFRGRWLEERWDLRNGGLGPSEEEGMRAKGRSGFRVSFSAFFPTNCMDFLNLS